MTARRDTETDPEASAPAREEASSLSPGDLLPGGYRVERLLGRGGMAQVVEATDLALSRTVAIKILHAAAARRPGARDRFQREARALAALHGSEHVVRVFGYGETTDAVPFIVMEHLTGHDLAAELRRSGPFPPTEAVRLALQVCDALAAAHASGIVHRDLKPGNLLLTSDADGHALVKVVDFGIAKVAPADDPDLRTGSGSFLGTLAFAAPEQVDSTSHADERSDVWSLGVTLYLMLTDRFPFSGDTRDHLAASIHRHTPVPPARLCPELPPGLDAVILRCLEKDPERRIPDVAVLARALLPFSTPDTRRLVERIERRLAAPPDSRRGATRADATRADAAPSRGVVEYGEFRLEGPTPTPAVAPARRGWFSSALVGVALVALVVLVALNLRALTADRPAVVFLPAVAVPAPTPSTTAQLAFSAAAAAPTSTSAPSATTATTAPTTSARAAGNPVPPDAAKPTAAAPRPASAPPGARPPTSDPPSTSGTENAGNTAAPEPTYPNVHLDPEPGSP